jgi:hypothetical protein
MRHRPTGAATLVGVGRIGHVGIGAVPGRLVVTAEALRFETVDGTTELRAETRPVLRVVAALVAGRLVAWNEVHRRWDTIYAGWFWRGVRRDLRAHGWDVTTTAWRAGPPPA